MRLIQYLFEKRQKIWPQLACDPILREKSDKYIPNKRNGFCQFIRTLEIHVKKMFHIQIVHVLLVDTIMVLEKIKNINQSVIISIISMYPFVYATGITGELHRYKFMTLAMSKYRENFRFLHKKLLIR